VASGKGSLGWIVAGVLAVALVRSCGGNSDIATPPQPFASAEVGAASNPSPLEMYVQSKRLNCRSGKSVEAAIVERFAINDRVSVVEESAGWSRLAREPACWVASRYLAADRKVEERRPDPPAPRPVMAIRRGFSGGGGGCFANCSAARAAGAAPVYASDPGYCRRLDRDGDGVGCE